MILSVLQIGMITRHVSCHISFVLLLSVGENRKFLAWCLRGSWVYGHWSRVSDMSLGFESGHGVLGV